jgi:hypothetical protein
VIDREAITKLFDPLKPWHHQCHGASIHLVKSGLIDGPCRVARGACEGVGGQHSWVVLGNDCYDEKAEIIDPTLWSYDSEVEGIWYGSYADGRHTPHGKGWIWAWGRPDSPRGPVIELTPRRPFSQRAQDFLDMLGPLDRQGWSVLAHAPVGGWPAGEIIDAMCESGLDAVIPIDIVGMVTDRNPQGLYLPENA